MSYLSFKYQRYNISTLVSACNSVGLGSLLSVSGAVAWTYFSISYTATKVAYLLQFAVHGGPGGELVYLDDVSMVDVTQSGSQKLINPSFETTTLYPLGWLTLDKTSCTCATSGDGGKIVTSGCHSGSGNNCYKGRCNGGYYLLVQGVLTTIGDVYNISFWYTKSGGGAGILYVDMV